MQWVSWRVPEGQALMGTVEPTGRAGLRISTAGHLGRSRFALDWVLLEAAAIL